MDAADEELLKRLAPPVAAWVRATFPRFTEAQRRALPRVLADESVLLSSPTGTGKTLSAFLGILSRLHARAAEGGLARGTHALYVSPLKALVHDVAVNLRRPVEGMEAFASAGVTVGLRTGDTPPAERARQARDPPHVLATTPESLALLLASASWRPHLAHVRWVVVDEVHALAGTKRGAHLALLLELLEARVGRPLVRIGLSATVSPLPEVARLLAGAGRACAVEVAPPPDAPPEVRIVLPLPDPVRAREEELERATLDLLEDLVARHGTTLVFANTRRLAERHSLLLQERLERGDEAGDDVDEDATHDPEFPRPERAPPVAPHHGSMSRDARLVVEERLRRGELKCVVSSSSLELGIDVASVDHVVLLGSPRSVARALQRLGRADHRVGGRSRGTLVVTDPDELPEAYALVERMLRREVEDVRIPDAPLDVLAQLLVALAAEGPYEVEEATALARRAHPYRDVTPETVARLVAMLAAGPGALLARERGRVRLRGPGARVTYLTHVGTIPESGTLKVLHGDAYVGEVEEAFVEGLAEGDVFALAGRSWRFLRAQARVAHVAPAAFAPPTVPAWRSEGVSAPPELALAASNAFYGLSHAEAFQEETWERFEAHRALQGAFSAIPSPAAACIESFLHDEGGRAHVVHAPLGRRACDALARVAAHRLDPDGGVRASATDAGFRLLTRRAIRPSAAAWRALLAPPLEADLRAALAGSETLRRRFRHVAARGLLLPRRMDRPLARRQAESDALLRRLLAEEPDHPMLEETWRETLHDALDLDTASRFARALAAREAPVVMLPPRPCASPRGARILHRPTTPEGREAVRDHEERAREWLAQAREG